MCILLFVENVGSRCVDLVKLVQLGARLVCFAEDVSFEEPWHRLGDLEVHVRPGGYGKDIVEFFKRSLLGTISIVWKRSIRRSSTYLCFRKPEPDHDECYSIKGGVETEGTLRPHSL